MMHGARDCMVKAAVIALLAWMGVTRAKASEREDADLRMIGVAAIDITPSHPIRLNGFGGRRAESEGVRQPIRATALAIGGDADGPTVLLAIDTLGVPESLRRLIAQRLEKCGVRIDRLAMSATHTHSAPMIRDVSPTIFGAPIPDAHREHIDRYSDELKEKLERVALAALSDRRPARLAYAIGTVRFAINRRTKSGPVDHDLPVLTVTDPNGKLRALFVSYACHCVTLSDNRISGDWAGYAAAHIERRHPGCTALVAVGCGADSNPNTGVTGSREDLADSQGVEIAAEVDRLLGGKLVPVTGPLVTNLKDIALPLAPLPTRDEWERRATDKGAIGHHARTNLARLDRGEMLPTSIEYPIVTWSFGDSLAMVFLPGEVVVDYAKRLKRELDGSRLWINAYSNGCPGYVPSERVLKEGGYEGGGAMIYYDIPAAYSRGLEEKIVGAVRDRLGKVFKPVGDPSKTQGSLPRRPEHSMAAIRTRSGLVVELVASEPLVASPVAIDFGPDGKLWVAEMFDYPTGVSGDYQPGGRIKLLQDADGDGRFDTASVFLDGIPFPTGVTVWRGGVLVCAAPDIIFAEDINGDGRADRVEKLFSGFGTENYQGRVNSLRYGLDGWVYGSCGLYGGTIKNASGKAVELGNRDFRIRPDTGELEPVAGASQQGRVRDDWGNWFGCDNSTLIRHYVVHDVYVRRNPHVAPPRVADFIFKDADPNRLFPISEPVVFPLSGGTGRVTAACGLEIYRDDLLGLEFAGNAFTCEPVCNLVHRLQLLPHGVTFAGSRPKDELASEFLASSDNWFRPVEVRTGPDGALWIVDMYRYVIEHPRWIPPATVATLDVRAGHDMGRIYRVYPKSTPKPLWPAQAWQKRGTNSLPQGPHFSNLTTSQLASALDSPNGWQRDMALQLLQWRNARDAVAALKSLVGVSSRPQTRLHALVALHMLGGLDSQTARIALNDKHAAVRRQGVRVSERLVATDNKVDELLAALTSDLDAAVRLQVAYSLGAQHNDATNAALARFYVAHFDDDQLRAAAFSSLNMAQLSGFTKEVLRAVGMNRKRVSMVMPVLDLAVAMGDLPTVGEALESAHFAVAGSAGVESYRIYAKLLDALARRRIAYDKVAGPEVQRHIMATTIFARGDAANVNAPVAIRMAAVQFLKHVPQLGMEDVDILSGLLGPQTPPSIQAEAIDAIAAHSGQVSLDTLLAAWNSYTPSLHGRVLDALLSRNGGAAAVVVAIESGRILVSHIDAARAQKLMTLRDPGLRKRAEKALAAVDADRQKVIDAHQDVVSLAGDVAAGKIVFAKACAGCHQLEGVGHVVGQNLASLGNRSPQSLLIQVLDPSRQMDGRFVAYIAALRDGRSITGVMAAETSSSITLKSQDGKEETILRADLDELRNTGKSLMPDGLERDLSKQNLADLFAYLAQIGPQAKRFAGNTPAIVKPAADGSLALLATLCEIYGDQIVFEQPFRNIGWWHGEQDHVVWSVETDRDTPYDVWLDYASHPDAAGDAFAFDGVEPAIRGTVVSTGGWDRYRQAKMGVVSLPPGRHRLSFRPDGPLKRTALLDLRAVVLVPTGNAPKFTWATAQADDAAARDSVADPRRSSPANYARRILDPTTADVERSAIIQSQPHLAAELIAELAAGLQFGTPAAHKEEYRRIPWIWRVAVTAGKRNEVQRIRSVLNVALPIDDEPLRDWQAVVIGGGIINGVSQSGAWPRPRLLEIIGDDKPLHNRFQRALELASAMADNAKTPSGTRYDALRMLGVEPWERRGKQVSGYLAKGTHDELQMGAISALADIDAPESAAALLAGFRNYSPHNRNLAVDALLRSEERRMRLRQAIDAGSISRDVVGGERILRLERGATK